MYYVVEYDVEDLIFSEEEDFMKSVLIHVLQMKITWKLWNIYQFLSKENEKTSVFESIVEFMIRG